MILEGVRTNLETRPGLEVLVLDHPLYKPFEELRAMSPAAVIFDLGATQPDFLLPLLQQPGLLLIGIDPESHQARVWSGRQAAAAQAADLIDIIHKGRRGDTVTRRMRDARTRRGGEGEIMKKSEALNHTKVKER